jgi:hypothetical protein
MATYTFTTVNSRVKFPVEQGVISIPRSDVNLLKDNSGRILLLAQFDITSKYRLDINPAVDTVIIDATTYNAGGNSTTLFDALLTVFPDATTSGGGGGSTTDASLLTTGTLNDARLSGNIPTKAYVTSSSIVNSLIFG